MSDLLISDGQVTKDVERVKDHVEPVILSAVLSHVLRIVYKGVNATDNSFNCVEAVRHDSDFRACINKILKI